MAVTLLSSSESPVSAHHIIICSVLFSLFAFEELGVKVQEKSAEHCAEIFTPLFLYFDRMPHYPP